MPLPPNTTLALHGVSKPGEPLYSKPKQAIIVRLTSETLDALDSVVSGQNTLEFDFTKEWVRKQLSSFKYGPRIDR